MGHAGQSPTDLIKRTLDRVALAEKLLYIAEMGAKLRALPIQSVAPFPQQAGGTDELLGKGLTGKALNGGDHIFRQAQCTNFGSQTPTPSFSRLRKKLISWRAAVPAA